MLRNSNSASHDGRYYTQALGDKVNVYEMKEYGYTLLGQITNEWLREEVGDKFVPMSNTAVMSGDGKWIFVGATGWGYDGLDLTVAEQEESVLDGCVYVLEVVDKNIRLHKQLFSPKRQVGNKFGYDIVVNDDASSYAISAPGENRFEGGGNWCGAVYTYRGLEEYAPSTRLAHKDPKDNQKFGEYLAMDRTGNRLLIYSNSDNADHRTDELTESGINVVVNQSGTIDHYDYDVGTWTYRGILRSMEPKVEGFFGKYLNLSGDGNSLLVFENNIPEWSTPKHSYDNDIYLYRYIDGKWKYIKSLRQSIDDEKFGYTSNYINYDGNMIMIPSCLSEVNGVIQAGKVYMFYCETDDTVTMKTLVHPGVSGADMTPKRFGITITGDQYGDRILIGSYLESRDPLLGSRYRFHTVTIE